MLKSFLKFFEDTHKRTEPTYTVELATAALLSEIVNADNEVTDSERSEYEKQLRKHVNIDEEAMSLLLERGQETADDSIDLVRFTQVLNKHCSADEKRDVIKSLWAIAYADESLAPLEESTIRQIADLLYVPHSQYIKTKLEVVERTQRSSSLSQSFLYQLKKWIQIQRPVPYYCEQIIIKAQR